MILTKKVFRKRLNLVFSLFFITTSLFSCAKKTRLSNNTISNIENNNNLIYEKSKKSVVRVISYSENFDKLIDRASGVVIDKKKHILTNYHAVKDAKQFCIQKYDSDEQISADLLIVDEFEDLAILRPKNTKGLEEITFSSTPVKIGDRCVSISFPSSKDYPIDEMFLSSGYVGGIFKPIRSEYGDLRGGMIVSDTRTLTGSSGGALVNKNGELIALNLSVMTDNNNVSFSCGYSSNELSRVVNKMFNEYNKRKLRSVRKAWLDLYMVPVYRVIEYIDTSRKKVVSDGIMVTRVIPEGNCDGILKSGDRDENISGKKIFVDGDIIKKINDCEIHTISDVYTSLRDKVPGDKVEVKFFRGKTELSEIITLSQAPEDHYKYFELR